MTTATIIPRMGRKRRPPPKGKRTFREKFAHKLHELAHDTSNKDIARKCGVSRTAVYNWFNAEDSPSFDVLPKLANVLGVDVSELFNFE